jgi:Tfp pilus assembly protein PilW
MFTRADPATSRLSTRIQHAWTLMEMMVTLVIGTAVLAAVGVTCSFANRTLDAIGNYADLDRQSSNALNLMARDVRQTGALTNFNSGALWFTNMSDGNLLKYWWNSDRQTLNWTNQSTAEGGVLLKGCISLSFSLFQRTPVAGTTMTFNSTTNASLAKVVVLEWVCRRTNFLSLANSESVQTAKIVLRN